MTSKQINNAGMFLDFPSMQAFVLIFFFLRERLVTFFTAYSFMKLE